MFQSFLFEPLGCNLEVNLACLSRIKDVASYTHGNTCVVRGLLHVTVSLHHDPHGLLSGHD